MADYNIIGFGGIFVVIYVDVLFLVNFLITFFLLLLTSKLSKNEINLLRAVAGSLIGGVYSLVILADDLKFFVSYLGKFAAGCIIVAAAFKINGFKNYIKEVVIFFFSNLIFVGVIVGGWMIFKPPGVVINNNTIYFNISAKLLLFSALAAYVVSTVVIRIYNNKIAKKEIYRVTVEKNGKEFKFFAFADSGNNLKEPFSNYPVIVADKNLFEGVETERLVPYSTIGSQGVLNAFKPNEVTVCAGNKKYSIQNVYIALNDNLKKGEFRGIINPNILNDKVI